MSTMMCLFQLTTALLLLVLPLVSSQTSVAWQRVWVSSNMGSTFAAPGTLCDPDADGRQDLALASVNGELVLVDLETGRSSDHSLWPIYRHSDHFFSSPIVYDANFDGYEDVIFISHSGEILIYSTTGEIMTSYQLPGLYLKKDWHTKALFLTGSELDKVVSRRRPSNMNEYIELSPQIFTSGQIWDVNSDSRLDEMILLVNYALPSIKNTSQKEHLDLLATLVTFNFSTLSVAMVIPLEVTEPKSEFPSYLLSNPVIADLAPHVPGLEIVITTASGRIYVVNGRDGQLLSGYPVEYGSMQHPVLLVDSSANQKEDRIGMSMIVADMSGNVAGFVAATGRSIWEFSTANQSRASELMSLVDARGRQQVLFGTESGLVYLLWAHNGSLVHGYPVSFHNQTFTKPPVIYEVNNDRIATFISKSGILCSVSLSTSSTSTFFLNETSHLSPLLLPPRSSAHLLLFSHDGAVFRYSPILHNPERTKFSSVDIQQISYHDLFIGQHIYSGQHSAVVKETGLELSMDYIVVDHSHRNSRSLCTMNVYFGAQLIYSTPVSLPLIPSTSTSLSLPLGNLPRRGRLSLHLMTSSGRLLSDSLHLSFNWHFLSHLCHLLYLPSLCAMAGLLILTINREKETLLPLISTPKS